MFNVRHSKKCCGRVSHISQFATSFFTKTVKNVHLTLGREVYILISVGLVCVTLKTSRNVCSLR